MNHENDPDRTPHPDNIAHPEEILQLMTRIMRGTLTEMDKKGEEIGPKVAERARAAEMLGKRYGLFAEAEHQGDAPAAIAAEIEQTLADYILERQPPAAPDHAS